MSSNLTSFVPVLDGTNYQKWATAMQAYLMSLGQWKTTKEGATVPNLVTTKLDGVETGNNQSDIDAWNETAEKAVGNICLRLSESIGSQFTSVEDPAEIWESLKEKYGSPGMPSAFIEFKGVMETVIPSSGDPAPAIDKILSHHHRLSAMQWSPPSEFFAMILLAKSPAYMEPVVQMIMTAVQGKVDEKTKKPLKPSLDHVVQSMIHSYEMSRRSGAKSSNNNQNQQRAHKLSAVKPWDQQGPPPQFQQQQQQYAQQPQEGGQKKGRRGRRGGKKNNNQQLQNAAVDAAPQQQQQAQQPSFIPPPPPTFQFQAGPSSGFFSNSIAHHVRPSVQFPPPNTDFKSPYRSFTSALDLAHAIGVRPTTEVLRTLEIPALLKEEKEAKRPSKRP